MHTVLKKYNTIPLYAFVFEIITMINYIINFVLPQHSIVLSAEFQNNFYIMCTQNIMYYYTVVTPVQGLFHQQHFKSTTSHLLCQPLRCCHGETRHRCDNARSCCWCNHCYWHQSILHSASKLHDVQ